MDIELICVAGALYALLITFMIHLDFEHMVLIIISFIAMSWSPFCFQMY